MRPQRRPVGQTGTVSALHGCPGPQVGTGTVPADSREPDDASETDAASSDAPPSPGRTPWAQLPNRTLLR